MSTSTVPVEVATADCVSPDAVDTPIPPVPPTPPTPAAPLVASLAAPLPPTAPTPPRAAADPVRASTPTERADRSGGAPFTPTAASTVRPPIVAAPAWLSQSVHGMASGPTALAQAGLATNSWAERTDAHLSDTVISARQAAASGWKVDLTAAPASAVTLNGDVVAGHDGPVQRVLPEWNSVTPVQRRTRRRGR